MHAQITELKKASLRIRSIVGAVKEIADQTGLLAPKCLHRGRKGGGRRAPDLPLWRRK
ncbi:hypothetical protein WJ0W_006972 [Paenibacillus melissococcoides]|uniref:Uncharacterized protein n=1 Tax=Paenibacillus melissococcoides TaxID=2912268 RepID=A0ABM9GEP8_9BACL|nr:hypothetical protein J6TS7_30600 [Paenibacillus dendritiformis]CAH8249788.1 hypothetical protein WJ0W_006972 [Paenibacillus melissococcoides]CAH8721735.1 hypothetical protein WDD9_006438 [Paenibacillus melissococcoides]